MKLFAIIPVYNVAQYLPDFFKSLEEQDYQNITYVLVNDGSTDESGKLCREQVKRDARFHLIEQRNGGVSSARNAGLDYVENNSAQGDYTLFFDPDDYLTSKDAIKLISNEIKENYSDLIIYNYAINNTLTINRIKKGGGNSQSSNRKNSISMDASW